MLNSGVASTQRRTGVYAQLVLALKHLVGDARRDLYRMRTASIRPSTR